MDGRFNLVHRYNDGTVKRSISFKNLITDSGLNAWGNGRSDAITSCFLGTGNAAPQVSDISLQTQVTSTSNVIANSFITDYVSGTPDYIRTRRAWRFSPGSLNNVNVAEVGVGSGSSSLFSRARIVDTNGLPAVITILPDEFLDVYWEFRFYPPTADATASVTISGAGTYGITVRPINVTSSIVNSGGNVFDGPTYGWRPFTGTSLNSVAFQQNYAGFSSPTQLELKVLTRTTLFARTATYSDVVRDTVSPFTPTQITSPYVNGTFYRDSELIIPDNQGVLTPGQRLYVFPVSALGNWQILLSDYLPKSADKFLRMNFRFSWGRA